MTDFDVNVFARALMRLWPHGDNTVKGLREGIITAAPIIFPKYGCASPLVICHAMAQFSEETGCGIEMQENMNYSAKLITRVWPSRKSAVKFAHNPQALADAVYNGRMGNKTASNDGFEYRGGGPLQATGRAFYGFLEEKTGIPFEDDPSQIEKPENWPLAAAVTWALNPAAGDISKYADQGNFEACCNAINRGNPHSNLPPIGWRSRQMWHDAWERALDITAIPASAPVDHSVIREGSPKIPTVGVIQEELARLGYQPGPHDMIYGPRVTRAVLAFQARNGLPATGAVDSATLAKLTSADAIPFPPSNAAQQGFAALVDAGHPEAVSAAKTRTAGHLLLLGAGSAGLDRFAGFDALSHFAGDAGAVSEGTDALVTVSQKLIEAVQFGAQHLFWVLGVLGGFMLWQAARAEIKAIKEGE
jgi:putative chitinase